MIKPWKVCLNLSVDDKCQEVEDLVLNLLT